MSLPGNQVPVSIVPRTKARIEISEDYVRYVAGNRSLSFEQVKSLIQSALEEALRRTILDAEDWINNHVPNRSGDLIKSILKYLRRSKPPAAAAGELRGVRLILGVGADITYAKYVNKMTIANVRHFNTWLEHSGAPAYSKGHPVLLNDFRAVGHFFDKMVAHARERLVINLAKVKYELQNTSSLTSRNLSQIQVSK